MKKTFLISIIFGCLIGFSQPLYSQTEDENNSATNVANGHEYVDLALPSGLMWATCNVGASKPEASGTYFAWGELTYKDEYTSSNSLTYEQEIDDISGNLQYDVVTRWGEGWRMPTKDEMQELIDNCTWEWTKQDDVKGYNVMGPNGNSIFLPAAGCKSNSVFNSGGCNGGRYWSSTPSSNSYAYGLYFLSSSHSVLGNNRSYGYTVRPVRDNEDTEAQMPFVACIVENYTDISVIIKTYVSSPGVGITERGFYWGTNAEPNETDNKVVLENEAGNVFNVLTELIPNTTYYLKAYATNSVGTSYSEVISFTTLAETEYNDYVDLGLSSGLKWAAYNVGATTAAEYGDYYAWGEVVTKEEYTEANSETYGESMSNISGTQYDAATVNWGGDWRMPTQAEIQELLDNCTWTWTTQGGKNGYKVTGPNGNSIFLPAAGCRYGSSLNYAGSSGRYWSSTPGSSNDAYYLGFNSSSHGVNYYGRDSGYTVRPVRE